MPDTARALIERHWKLANERQWAEFSTLLAPDLNYEVPQTREYAESGASYLEMFRTWPGDWKATVRTLVCEPAQAVCIIDFAVSNEVMTGISVFGIKDGKIIQVTDYWPEPYEPPPRMTPLLKRRAQ
jgi:hypothetical protein